MALARNGSSPSPAPVAIAHDYLTQRGGAERVVLSLTRAFPEAEVVTSFYAPHGTFPEFGDVPIRTAPIDQIRPLRQRHRLALPVLASTFSRMQVDADVVVCSSSGWAHGVRTTGRKLVYCHAPARWIYQRRVYTARGSATARTTMALLERPLRRWDRRASATADLYLANSTRTREMVWDAYGLDTEVVHPPHGVDPSGTQRPVPDLDPGFFLCVARLMPYKQVDLAVEAMASMLDERLVVVGHGPDTAYLQAMAGPNVTFLAEVDDAELRWLYDNAEALMAFGVEDFGLTPVEAAAFGTPAIVTPFGGYLDTVTDGVNGVHVAGTTPTGIVDAVKRLRWLDLDACTVRHSAEPFSEAVFAERMRSHVSALAMA